VHKLFEPQRRIIGIRRGQNVQGEEAKEPGGESARRRKSQRANKPRGRTGKGAKKARHQFLECVYVISNY